MHKYQLAIENYEFSDKVISKSIMNIIKHYEGVIDDASNSTIYFGFPDELKLITLKLASSQVIEEGLNSCTAMVCLAPDH